MPAASVTSSGTAPSTAVSVAWPMPSTTVLARLTWMLLGDVVHAGREDQVLAPGERVVDVPTESPGVAMKKSVIGMLRPAVSPSAQVIPRVPCCAAGTRT